MNFQTILEELDRLYEEETVMADAEVAGEELKDEALTEAAEEPEVEEASEDVDVEEVEPEQKEVQLVLECANCGAVIIKQEADVVVDDETDLANVEEACQYCEETAGYKILGMLNPYEDVIEVVEESLEESTAATAQPSKYAWVVYDEYGEYVCAYPEDKEGEARREAKELFKATVKKEAIIDESMQEGIFNKRAEKTVKASEVKVGDKIIATDTFGKQDKVVKVKKVGKRGNAIDIDHNYGNMTIQADSMVTVLTKLGEGIFSKRVEKEVKASEVKVGDKIVATSTFGKQPKIARVKKVGKRGNAIDIDHTAGNMTIQADSTVTVLTK